MSLVELPGTNGQIIAVNPHHVSACQPYRGRITGKPGEHDMTAVWVNNHNIYVCAWKIDAVLEVLNGARSVEAQAYEAGYRAGSTAYGGGSVIDCKAAFSAFTGQFGEPEITTR